MALKLVQKHDKSELTIVSRKLLRVSSSEWSEPGRHFQCLRGEALQALLAEANSMRGSQALVLRLLLWFDCLLRVTGSDPISSPLAFATPRFRQQQLWFYGALGSAKFINIASATRRDAATKFGKLLSRLQKTAPVSLLEHRFTQDSPIPQEFVEQFEQLHLNRAAVDQIRPFLLTAKSGHTYNVLLGGMVDALGTQFTAEFHEGLCNIARPKAKDTALRDFGTTFVRFVQHRATSGQPVTKELLQDQEAVQIILVDFMEFHFLKMTKRKNPVQETTLGSLQKLWTRYRGYWDALSRQGILALPFSAFPEGNPRLLRDDSVGHRRVVKAEDGNLSAVTQKLLRPVPLHISDEQATQLMFKQLKEDFETVRVWLRQHLEELWLNYEQGCKLAETVVNLPDDDALIRAANTSRNEPDALALAVKYFKNIHGGYLDTSTCATPIYPKLSARGRVSKAMVSRLLGLPSRSDALAIMGFLASVDGRLSESALSGAILLDGKGRRINAVESDAGLTLTVLKERDAGDGWHDVVLDDEAARFVRRWIQLTQPLRSYMRENGVSGWQNLFVYVGKPLGAGGHFNRADSLHSAFHEFALTNKKALGDLAGQVSIARIRSTKGVIVFLETMDLAAMARELGNTNETSLLQQTQKQLTRL